MQMFGLSEEYLLNALISVEADTHTAAEKTREIISMLQQGLTQMQTEHLIIMGGIGVLLIVGIAILINQRKIKKQLKKLLEEKDKP